MPIEQFEILAGDGEAISAAFYSDGSRPAKGVVIVVYGFGEHAGSYGELAQKFAEAGFAAVVFDQRGHGARYATAGGLQPEADGQGERGAKRPTAGSKDMRGIIPSYQCFLDDIEAVCEAAKQKAPGVPVSLFGHSMGGNIVINYLLRHEQSDYACAILETPWLGLQKKINPLITFLAKIIGRLSPNVAIINKLSPCDLTGDAKMAEGFKNDPLYHNRISLRMFTGINNGCKYALANASKLTLPIFLASAREERIVSNRAIAQFANDAGSNVTEKDYKSCHAIHNDGDREAFFEDAIGFLNAHCPEKPEIRS